MSVVMKALTAKAAEKGASHTTPVTSQYVEPEHRSNRWTPLATVLTIVLALVLVGIGGMWVVRTRPNILVPVSGVAPNVTLAVPTPITAQEARALFDSGQYDQSLPLFQRLVQQQPNDALLQNDLGMVFLKKELYSSAQVHLTRALELNPNCAVCYGNLGYLKTLLQQYPEAETYLQKAIQLQPNESKHYFNLAVLYEKNGDYGNGTRYYQQFLDLLPGQDSEIARKVQARIGLLTGQ